MDFHFLTKTRSKGIPRSDEVARHFCCEKKDPPGLLKLKINNDIGKAKSPVGTLSWKNFLNTFLWLSIYKSPSKALHII